MSVQKIIKMKGKEKIAVLTCYDALTARILAQAGIDIILVGDSLGNAVMGYASTVPVTMEEMLHHARAVRNGAPDTFIIADMPFLSYGASVEDSIKNAGRMLKDARANAVKMEGGAELSELIKRLVQIGIPVMGHIGLKPQSVNKSGHKIEGKTDAQSEALLKDAKALEVAGAFSIVLEGVTEEAAKYVSESIAIPTIGIGAGRYTDGQVLVITDMLGLDNTISFKHNKKYANLFEIIGGAVQSYKEEVKAGIFPGEANAFHKE